MYGLFAITAMVFFVAFAAIVAIYGGNTSRYLVAWALLAGAASQFVGQDMTPLQPYARYISIFLAYAGMILAAASLVTWSD